MNRALEFYINLAEKYYGENYSYSQTNKWFTIRLDSKVIVKICKREPFKVYVHDFERASLMPTPELPFLTLKKHPVVHEKCGEVHTVNTPLIFDDAFDKKRKRRKRKLLLSQQGQDYISTLPLEVLQYIFRIASKSLRNLLLVCKNFSKIIDEEFWSSVMLGYGKLKTRAEKRHWKRCFLGSPLYREINGELIPTAIKEKISCLELFADPRNFYYITAEGVLVHKNLSLRENLIPHNRIAKTFLIQNDDKIVVLFLDGECIICDDTRVITSFSSEFVTYAYLREVIAKFDNIINISLYSDLLILLTENFEVKGYELDSNKIKFSVPIRNFEFSNLVVYKYEIFVTRQDLLFKQGIGLSAESTFKNLNITNMSVVRECGKTFNYRGYNPHCENITPEIIDSTTLQDYRFVLT